MRKVFIRTVFAGLFALASAGISHAAEANISNCSGFPIQYHVLKGDWVSTIAESAYFNIPHNMKDAVRLIAEVNGIEDPDRIFVGDVLTIPCSVRQTVASKRFIAPEPTAVTTEVAEITAPEISIRRESELPMFSAQFPTLAPPKQAEQGENVIAFEATQPSVPVETMAWNGNTQPSQILVPAVLTKGAPAKKARIKKLSSGTYHTAIPLEIGLPEGRFSAFVLRNQDVHKRWRHREETVVVIRKTDVVSECTVFVSNPKPSDVVAFEIPGIPPLEINMDKFSPAKVTLASHKFAKVKYDGLNEIYPGVPSSGLAIFASAARMGPPIALTYFTGGLLPAAIAGGTFGFQAVLHSKAKREAVSQAEINKQLTLKITELEGRLSAFEARDTGLLAKQ